MATMDRICFVLSGLLFNFNALNYYMSRSEFTDTLLSPNKIIVNIIKMAKEVHKDTQVLMTFPKFVDMIARYHNVPPDQVRSNDKLKLYVSIYEKCKAIYEEQKGDDFSDLWRAELKYSIDDYIRRVRLAVSKAEHLMMKQECFGLWLKNNDCKDCEIKHRCTECNKKRESPLAFVQVWREEREEEIRSLTRKDGKVKAYSYASPEYIEERIDYYKRMKDLKLNSDTKTFGIPFSIPTLNRWTDGWVKQRACNIAGRTGQGKTALAIQEELYAFMNSSTNVLHFNLEMPQKELDARLDSGLTAVLFNKILRGEFSTEDEYDKYVAEMKKRFEERKFPNEFILMDTPNLSIAEFRYYVRQYYNKWGDNFIVCLDNLNIMKIDGKNKRNEEVNRGAMVFHETMKEYNISGMLLTQLNRDADGETDIRPKHYRDSDSILDHMDWGAAIIPRGPQKKTLVLVKGRSFVGDRIVLENELKRMRLIESNPIDFQENGADDIVDEDEKFMMDVDGFLDGKDD